MSSSALARLDGLSVLLSASLPKALQGSARALDFQGFLVTFVRGLLAAGGRLIFGGHPSLTPLLQRVAKDFGEGNVDLFQLTRFRDVAPAEMAAPQFVLRWVAADKLGPLRDKMVAAAQAAVFVGGKTQEENPIDGLPGIRDEYERFVRCHPKGPAYLLGLLDGETERLIAELGEGDGEPNGLSTAERQALHRTTDVDLAASLVLADLRRFASGGRHAAGGETTKKAVASS